MALFTRPGSRVSAYRKQLLLKNSIISFEHSTETFCSVFTRIINFSRILQNGSIFFKIWSVGTLAHYFSCPVKSVKTTTCTCSRGERTRPSCKSNYLIPIPCPAAHPPLYRPYKGVSPPENPVKMYWRVKRLCLSFCVMLFLHFTLLNQCFKKIVMSIANALLVGKKSII